MQPQIPDKTLFPLCVTANTEIQPIKANDNCNLITLFTSKTTHTVQFYIGRDYTIKLFYYKQHLQKILLKILHLSDLPNMLKYTP